METKELSIFSVNTIAGNSFEIATECETIEDFKKELEDRNWYFGLYRENDNYILNKGECIKAEFIESFNLSVPYEMVVIERQ